MLTYTLEFAIVCFFSHFLAKSSFDFKRIYEKINTNLELMDIKAILPWAPKKLPNSIKIKAKVLTIPWIENPLNWKLMSSPKLHLSVLPSMCNRTNSGSKNKKQMKIFQNCLILRIKDKGIVQWIKHRTKGLVSLAYNPSWVFLMPKAVLVEEQQ